MTILLCVLYTLTASIDISFCPRSTSTSNYYYSMFASIKAIKSERTVTGTYRESAELINILNGMIDIHGIIDWSTFPFLRLTSQYRESITDESLWHVIAPVTLFVSTARSTSIGPILWHTKLISFCPTYFSLPTCIHLEESFCILYMPIVFHILYSDISRNQA